MGIDHIHSLTLISGWLLLSNNTGGLILSIIVANAAHPGLSFLSFAYNGFFTTIAQTSPHYPECQTAFELRYWIFLKVASTVISTRYHRWLSIHTNLSRQSSVKVWYVYQCRRTLTWNTVLRARIYSHKSNRLLATCNNKEKDCT